jgi:hypothetical protein
LCELALECGILAASRFKQFFARVDLVVETVKFIFLQAQLALDKLAIEVGVVAAAGQQEGRGDGRRRD